MEPGRIIAWALATLVVLAVVYVLLSLAELA